MTSGGLTRAVRRGFAWATARLNAAAVPAVGPSHSRSRALTTTSASGSTFTVSMSRTDESGPSPLSSVPAPHSPTTGGAASTAIQIGRSSAPTGLVNPVISLELRTAGSAS